MVVPEVLKHRGGASAAGYERPVAVHAARLLGDIVAICLLEVVPCCTSVWAASVGAVWRGERNTGRRSRRAGSLEGRLSVIQSGVVAVSSSSSDAIRIHVHHGSAQGCNWWRGELQRGAEAGISDRRLLEGNQWEQ